MFLKSFFVTSLVLVTALVTRATPINLTSYAAQPANSGDATIEAFLNTSITGYNTANNPDLPSPAGAQVFRINKNAPANGLYPTFPTFGEDKLSLTLPMGFFNYVVLHWGGRGGGLFQSFYIGGDLTGTANFAAPGQNGLSSYSLFSAIPKPTPTPPPPTKVPDTASTLGLAALALVGLVGLRRRA